MNGLSQPCSIFNGWYRKSLSRNSLVWHRVVSEYDFSRKKLVVNTVCGRQFKTTDCDFDIEPHHKCLLCQNASTEEVGPGFAAIGLTWIPTRASAIVELKRLLKPRVYYFRIFGNQGVRITATWECGTDLDIDTQNDLITRNREKGISEMHEIQADLARFKSAVDCLCDATTLLAKADKKKRGVKGRLTAAEDQDYFEDMMYGIVKQKHDIHI